MKSVKEFKILIISNELAYNFLSSHHYLGKNISNRFEVAYGLFDKNMLIGVMGITWANYENIRGTRLFSLSQLSYVNNSLKIKYLACIDETPKNTESYFIGGVLKKIKILYPKVKGIISFAGGYGNHPNHNGTIYKASNFKLIAKVLVNDKGKQKFLYMYNYNLNKG